MIHAQRSILRRVPVFIALAALLVATLGGPFLIVCRAPGGHFGTKVLILSSLADRDDCCDCTTCGLAGQPQATDGAPSIQTGSCGQPCNDTSLSQPFTHAVFRADDLAPIATPAIDAFAISGLPIVRVLPGAESLGAPPILEYLRTSVLLI